MTAFRRSPRESRPRMNTAELVWPKPQDLAKSDALRILPPREDSAKIRRIAYERDHGVCAECHLDTDALHKEWVDARTEDDAHFVCNICNEIGTHSPCDACGSKLLTRSRECRRKFRLKLIAMNFPRKFAEKCNGGTFWEANHRVGVFESGGSAGSQNIETLCLRCHAKATKYQAETRKLRRRWR